MFPVIVVRSIDAWPMPKQIRQVAVALLIIGIGLLLLFWSHGQRASGPLNRFVFTIINPFQRAIRTIKDTTGTMWSDYIYLVNVRQENLKLRSDIKKLENEKSALLNREWEIRRLRKLFDLKESLDFPTVIAQIIAEDATGWYRTIFIDKGSEDRITRQMPVTASGGLIGKVTSTSSTMSRVLLITDPNLSVDCRVARTRDRGLLSGHIEDGCILRFVDLNSTMKAGDKVVTSGLDGIFPKDLLVGEIQKVRQSSRGLFLEALVRPMVDCTKIEDVMVILGTQGGFDIRPNLGDEQ